MADWVTIILVVLGFVLLIAYTGVVGLAAWAWDKRFGKIPTFHMGGGKPLFIDPKYVKKGVVEGDEVVKSTTGPFGMFTKEVNLSGGVRLFRDSQGRPYMAVHPGVEFDKKEFGDVQESKKTLAKVELEAAEWKMKYRRVKQENEADVHEKVREIIRHNQELMPFSMGAKKRTQPSRGGQSGY